MLGHKSAAMTLHVFSGPFDDDPYAVAERRDAASTEFLADYVRTSGAVVGLTVSE
jgi:hypothetical protein